MQKEKSYFILGDSAIQKGQKYRTLVTDENTFYHINKKM